MIPPDHDPTTPADPIADMTTWLRRSVASARRLTYICGLGWFTFLLWVIFTNPVRLGPERMLPAIILGSLTVGGGNGWWHAKTQMLHWRAISSLYLHHATNQAIAAVTATPGRPTLIKDGQR